MQEPQYAAGEIGALLGRVAAAGVPTMSIMNMPPLTFLQRIAGLDAASLRAFYVDSKVCRTGLTLIVPCTIPTRKPLNHLKNR